MWGPGIGIWKDLGSVGGGHRLAFGYGATQQGLSLLAFSDPVPSSTKVSCKNGFLTNRHLCIPPGGVHRGG